MNVESLIERNGLARVASYLTLGSGEITDGVQLLISSRTVSRIDLNPMSGVETTTSGESSFDTIAKSDDGSFDLGQIPTCPITLTVLGNGANVIQKRMRMSPTMTDFVLSDDVKRTTLDDRTVFVATQIDQIVAIIERKCHVVNSCMRC